MRPSFALWPGVLLINGIVTNADGAFLGDLFSGVTEENCGGTLSEQTTENGLIADSYEAVLVAVEISSVIMIISSALLVCSFSCVLASLSFVSFSSSSTWLQFARTCISGCQRCHATERARPAFDDNIVRYVNSPVAHDAVPAQHDPLLFLGGVPFALPAPTKIIRFFRLRNLTFKNWPCRDWEHSAAWYAACVTLFSGGTSSLLESNASVARKCCSNQVTRAT